MEIKLERLISHKAFLAIDLTFAIGMCIDKKIEKYGDRSKFDDRSKS